MSEVTDDHDGRLGESAGAKAGSAEALVLENVDLRAECDALRAALREEKAALAGLAKVCDRAGLVYWTWSAETAKITFGLRGGTLLTGGGSEVGVLPSDYVDLFKRVHPDDEARVSKAYETADSTGTDFQIDYRIRGQDGEFRHVREVGIAEFDAAGHFTGHVGKTQDITELKLAEAARLRSEMRFREFFESAPISLWEEDWSRLKVKIDALARRGVDEWESYLSDNQDEIRALLGRVRFVEINQATVGLYRAADKQSVLDFIRCRELSSADLRRWGKVLAAFSAGQAEAVQEVSETTVDGKEVRLRMRAVIAPDSATSWSRVLFSVEDVSDRFEAEQRFRSVFKNANLAILLVSSDGRILEANKKLGELLGYSQAELCGMTIAAITLPEDLPETIRGVEKIEVGESESLVLEKRYVRKDGQIIWGLLSAQASRDAKGQVLYYVSAIQDITERKAAEDAVRRSEERFRVLFAHAPDAVVLLDPETATFVDANDNAVRLFGVDRERLLTLGPLDLSPVLQPDGTVSAQLAQAYITATMQGETPSFEWTHLDAAGEESFCEIRLVRLEFDDRVLVRGSMLDISERKAIEAQLRQSQKMEAVGHMTGGVAHDFNNFLGVIVGNLELAAERLDGDETTRDLIDRALDAAGHGAKTTQQLLAFSRRQPLKPQVIDAMALLTGMLDMLRRSLGDSIALEVTAEHGLWCCEVDPGQMESSLLNLAINAADAMPDGGSLSIGLSNVTLDGEANLMDAEPGDYVRVSVADSGFGMPAETCARAFEPFFTTKEVGRGTGLGLSMVYGFVRQSGGLITIDSEPGRGTTFEFFLPRAAVLASEATATEDGVLPAARCAGS